MLFLTSSAHTTLNEVILGQAKQPNLFSACRTYLFHGHQDFVHSFISSCNTYCVPHALFNTGGMDRGDKNKEGIDALSRDSSLPEKGNKKGGSGEDWGEGALWK